MSYSNNPEEHHLACLVMVTGGLDGPCDCGGRTKSPSDKVPSDKVTESPSRRQFFLAGEEVSEKEYREATEPRSISDRLAETLHDDEYFAQNAKCMGDEILPGDHFGRLTEEYPFNRVDEAEYRLRKVVKFLRLKPRPSSSEIHDYIVSEIRDHFRATGRITEWEYQIAYVDNPPAGDWLRGYQWTPEEIEKLTEQADVRNSECNKSDVRNSEYNDAAVRKPEYNDAADAMEYMFTKAVSREELETMYPETLNYLKLRDEVTESLSDEEEEIEAKYDNELFFMKTELPIASPEDISRAKAYGKLTYDDGTLACYQYGGINYVVESRGDGLQEEEEMSTRENLEKGCAGQAERDFGYGEGPDPRVDGDVRMSLDDYADLTDRVGTDCFDDQPGFRVESLRGEAVRKYIYSGGEVVLDNPTELWISPAGSHRVITRNGWVTYIPNDWIVVQWLPRNPAAPVQF